MEQKELTAQQRAKKKYYDKIKNNPEFKGKIHDLIQSKLNNLIEDNQKNDINDIKNKIIYMKNFLQ
jgi:hypothetical protein